jgi:cyclophilin family peptidyl-prolyl cis-trans isomerase
MKKLIFVAAVVVLFFSFQTFAVYPQVTLHITGAATGDIVLELYTDKAPITVANFISYVNSGFYNGLIFHRVVSSFMIQGGGYDPNLVQKTTGLLPAIINESRTGLSNLRGTVAMARTTLADSATSQFFINDVNNTFLDYGYPAYDNYSGRYYTQVGYTAFGKVIAGMSVVDAISILPTSTQNGMSNVPVNDVIIQSAVVTLNGGVCATFYGGDINKDCKVNFKDFALFAQNWMNCNSILPTCN